MNIGWLLGLCASWHHIADAQELVPLIQFSNVWRYEISGVDLGTAWQQVDYDDSTWSSGPGLLQGGESNAYPAPFNTVLPPPSESGTVTYYFRTRFSLPEQTFPPFRAWSIYATNFVDDGCVIFLNGQQAARIRMNPGPTHQTLAVAGPAVEGQPDLVVIDGSLLRSGENVVAVELHQNALGSADAVWGSHWLGAKPTPLLIVRQPEGTTNLLAPVVLSAEVSGGPAYFQWRKDGLPLVGATNSVLSLAGGATNSGGYTLVISNALGSVTSRVAQVLIAADQTGPIPQWAVANSTIFNPNLVDVRFDEYVLPSSVNVTNLSLTRMTTGSQIPLETVISSQHSIRIRFSPTNHWVRSEDYFVTLTGIADLSGNVMAPGTRVPVGWSTTNLNVVPHGQEWWFHNSAVFDPEVYSQNWMAPDYDVSRALWGMGSGHFHHFPGLVSCLGQIGDGGPEVDIGFQPEPYLFRSAFFWPPGRSSSNATLLVNFLADDGLVLFLNGREIYRYRQLAGPITAATRTVDGPRGVCVTSPALVVSNLFAGTNWLAAALTQTDQGDAGASFAFALDVIYAAAPILPLQPVPVLEMAADGATTGTFRLSWSGGGFALESAATLDGTLNYPFGPWISVSNGSNPYVLQATTNEPARFFRLKRH